MSTPITIDEILDTYWDRIKQGDELITTIQKDTKAQLSQLVNEIIGRDDKVVYIQNFPDESTYSDEKLRRIYRNKLRRPQRTRAIERGFVMEDK